jgi:phenylalanyl-tRNA synthetase alpha chain
MSESIIKQLEQIEKDSLLALVSVGDEIALQTWRIAHLGRSAPLMQIFTNLSAVEKEMRPQVGQRANQVKQTLEAAFTARNEVIRQLSLSLSLEGDRLDVTLPGRAPEHGRLHPLSQVLREMYIVFAEMGFQVYQSRDVENDDYNFTLLNIPPYHPARDMWDTFHTTRPGVLLRTHTSPGQIHAMREYAPQPVRVALPGMCYRYEQISVRRDIQFHQVELLAIGRKITFADMKGTLEDFARRIFGDSVKIRLRPSYFPFTEPSAEMDIGCLLCDGAGCMLCKQSGWVEIMGCGMVHPTVLTNGGYDPAQFTGFAAGIGPARVALLRYRIGDIRYFWQNDVRFLSQF